MQPDPTACAHHYILPDPEYGKNTIPGKCKKCGFERTFKRNGVDDRNPSTTNDFNRDGRLRIQPHHRASITNPEADLRHHISDDWDKDDQAA